VAKTIVVCLVLCLVVGCVTEPIPQGYKGPLATLRDSGERVTDSKALFFCIDAIDGKRIKNSVGETLSTYRGSGFYMKPIFVARQVPADTDLVLTMRGSVEFAAPILAIANSGSAHHAERIVSVRLKPNGIYDVKGELKAEGSSVWLEDIATGERVGVPAAAK